MTDTPKFSYEYDNEAQIHGAASASYVYVLHTSVLVPHRLSDARTVYVYALQCVDISLNILRRP